MPTPLFVAIGCKLIANLDRSVPRGEAVRHLSEYRQLCLSSNFA
jgi:hypothetical protein